jgi:hypothetical protein
MNISIHIAIIYIMATLFTVLFCQPRVSLVHLLSIIAFLSDLFRVRNFHLRAIKTNGLRCSARWIEYLAFRSPTFFFFLPPSYRTHHASAQCLS